MTGSPNSAGRRGGEDEQPARRDDADAERDVARIDEMNLQMRPSVRGENEANGLGERRGEIPYAGRGMPWDYTGERGRVSKRRLGRCLRGPGGHPLN